MLAASQLHGMADDGNPGTGAVTVPQLAMDFVLRYRHEPLARKAVASEAAARVSTRIAVPAVQKSAGRTSTGLVRSQPSSMNRYCCVPYCMIIAVIASVFVQIAMRAAVLLCTLVVCVPGPYAIIAKVFMAYLLDLMGAMLERCKHVL